jgi:hypothetical protein
LICKTIKIKAMKSISKNLFLILLAVTIPFMMASGQDKRSEKKVKIIVSDKDGTKTIIDTTFTGDSTPDSIALKNGKVIFFETPGTVTTSIKSGEGKENIYVTTTIDEEKDGEKSKEENVIIMSGDKGEWTVTPSSGTSKHVYAFASDDDKGGKTEKHVIVKSTGNKDAVWEDKDGKTFHVTVTSNNDTDTDMTKYVIAKDGVVVTVESNDEARAKEIIKVIESKLDVKTEGAEKKEVVNGETKKTVKK